jgi:tetratricopeptide (TPR) repeat protein
MTAYFLRLSFVVLLFALVSPCDPAIAQLAPGQESEIDRLGRQAETDLRDQKLDLAVADYRRILALDPANTNAHSNLGLAYYLQQQFAPAAEQFNIALRAKPDLWNIAALCGLAEARLQQNAKAASHLEQAFEHVADPSLRLAVGKQLFSILFESGDLIHAAEIVAQLQQLEPKNIDVLYAAHQVYSVLANQAFLTLAHLDPNSARMYQLWGDRMAQMGNARGAIAAYRKAIECDPNLSGLHVALGDALSASRSATDRATAEEEYKKALQVDPSDARAESKLGDIAMQRSDMQAASQHYRRALQIQPDDPEANKGLGIVYQQSQSYEDALVYLNRSIQLDPTDSIAYYHLSQVSKNLGDLDAAKREMDEFLKLKAEDQNMRRSFNSMSLGSGEEMPQPQDAIPTPTTAPVGSGASQSESPR